ncbi:F-box protein At2g26850 [Arachis duranensis]|uniref:F-box protein At2g26850 n=1 Tax=Arachis duranensis TaxID=130453 RepID=A0A6P4C7H7_ARADU|nr:F-box protein At2g26850 [Arachis duranensis]
MLYFLISFVSFVILSKSFTRKPHCRGDSSGGESKLVSTWFLGNLPSVLISRVKKGSIIGLSFLQFSLGMPLKKKSLVSNKLNNNGEKEKNMVSLLDLPDLPLEIVLEHLSPAELCRVGAVCKSLMDRSRSDYLWQKQMERKWGKVIGDVAYRQWQCHVASRTKEKMFNQSNQRGIFASLRSFSPFLWFKPRAGKGDNKLRNSLPEDSTMALYLSLESGMFWFPAQVYNRENGHAGFMLSCYDALLCYDSRTDTFQARYSPNGRWTTEENIQWDRLRVPPIDNSPHVLHISDCLDDLRPGDHIEIQWRRNKEFPYGWWYGVIGHLESCQGYANQCLCHKNDMVILEFNQYTPGSRWRQTMINRKHHREEGNEIDGFYGGIRKLHSNEEITTWKSLWPTKTVE